MDSNSTVFELLWSLIKSIATALPIAGGIYMAWVKHTKMMVASFTDVINAAVTRRDDWHDIKARIDIIEERQHEDAETLKRIDERIDEIYKLLIKTRS
jgi:hypothetical protein